MDKRVINCKECKEYKNLGGGLECCNKKWECFDKKENNNKGVKCDKGPQGEKGTNKIEPDYYHKGSVDTIKFCLENNLDFLQGNIVKYIVRFRDKNGMEDLRKAEKYLERLIESEKEKLKNA